VKARLRIEPTTRFRCVEIYFRVCVSTRVGADTRAANRLQSVVIS
jgi:hypothetical protein